MGQALPMRVQLPPMLEPCRLPESVVDVRQSRDERGLYDNPWSLGVLLVWNIRRDPREMARLCVEAFEAWLTGDGHWLHQAAPPYSIPKEPPSLANLRGMKLGCGCPAAGLRLLENGGLEPAKPWPHGPIYCHADALLRVANV